MRPSSSQSCSPTSLHGTTPLHRRLLREMGRAVRDFDLLSPGDRVAVGVSGGKDSLSLLKLLWEWPQGEHLGLSVVAIHIDLGFPDGQENEARLRDYLEANGYDFHIASTDIATRVRAPDARKKPCFLCARWRRQRLFEIAVEERCTKVALAHHRDDVLETFLLNLFYSREVSTMLPKVTFFDGLFDLIRPLAYVEERHLQRYAAQCGLPVARNVCPFSETSRRQFVKDLLAQLHRTDPRIKDNLFLALRNVNVAHLWGIRESS